MIDQRQEPKLNHAAPKPEGVEEEGYMLLEQAIAHLLCVRWTYNRTETQAEPHILYRRKNGIYLDAVVIERAGEKAAERKLGSFKLTGLTNLVIMNETFVPNVAINPNDARYDEGIFIRATK